MRTLLGLPSKERLGLWYLVVPAQTGLLYSMLAILELKIGRSCRLPHTPNKEQISGPLLGVCSILQERPIFGLLAEKSRHNPRPYLFSLFKILHIIKFSKDLPLSP
jgi:hypothetical protein